MSDGRDTTIVKFTHESFPSVRNYMVEVDISLSAQYVNMIGPLAKFVRASNSFKIVPRYFGKV